MNLPVVNWACWLDLRGGAGLAQGPLTPFALDTRANEMGMLLALIGACDSGRRPPIRSAPTPRAIPALGGFCGRRVDKDLRAAVACCDARGGCGAIGSDGSGCHGRDAPCSAPMGSTRRVLSLLAAIALAVGVVVIVVTPQILEAPNALAAPSALVVAIGSGGAGMGGRTGRRVGLAVSVTGLVLSGLWLWLAGDGFGLGAAWVDDMVEAAILVAAFVVATGLLALSEGPISEAKVAVWVVVACAVIVLAVGIVAPALPAAGPAPMPVPIPS